MNFLYAKFKVDTSADVVFPWKKYFSGTADFIVDPFISVPVQSLKSAEGKRFCTQLLNGEVSIRYIEDDEARPIAAPVIASADDVDNEPMVVDDFVPEDEPAHADQLGTVILC